MQTTTTRRHDLDWLRVIAFGLLILYHVGMFYVTWDWHIKSTHESTFAEPAMLLVNPWRLALLFFISGVAVHYALDKTTVTKFLRSRTVRLFVPLVFGMAVICMPQAYIELLNKGEIQLGVLAFWSQYFGLPPGPFSIITPTWNHLWYLAYVLVYTIIVALASPLLRRVADGPAARYFGWLNHDRSGLMLMVLTALPFLLYQAFLDPLFPTTNAMADDWANHAHSFTIFLLGYLAARDERFWNAIDRHWKKAAVIALVVIGVSTTAAWLNRVDLRGNELVIETMPVLRVVYAWAVIVTLLGLARRWLNRPGPALTYLSAAIFPYYILHQTLIIMLGWWLLDAGLSAPMEAGLIAAGTVAGCILGYEIIRRIPPLRPLFGLPMRDKGRAQRLRAGRSGPKNPLHSMPSGTAR